MNLHLDAGTARQHPLKTAIPTGIGGVAADRAEAALQQQHTSSLLRLQADHNSALLQLRQRGRSRAVLRKRNGFA